MGTLQAELTREEEIVKNCPFCGWPDDQVYVEASRHHTSDGLTVWTLCACGSLQVRAVDATGSRVVMRGRPQVDAASADRSVEGREHCDL